MNLDYMFRLKLLIMKPIFYGTSLSNWYELWLHVSAKIINYEASILWNLPQKPANVRGVVRCVSAHFIQPTVASQNDKNISERINSTLVLSHALEIHKAKLLPPSFFFIRLKDWGHNRNAISHAGLLKNTVQCTRKQKTSGRCTLPSVTPNVKSCFF
jgi:hypothetical protein